MSTIRARACLALLGCIALVSCSIPSDPEGTLEHIKESGELVVGVSHAPPWTDTSDGDVTGSEVELMKEFAAELDVRPRFVPGGEEHLVEELEEGAIDVVVGGLTVNSPWSNVAAPTRAYAETQGAKVGHVMLVRAGENRFLTELELFLDEAVSDD